MNNFERCTGEVFQLNESSGVFSCHLLLWTVWCTLCRHNFLSYCGIAHVLSNHRSFLFGKGTHCTKMALAFWLNRQKKIDKSSLLFLALLTSQYLLLCSKFTHCIKSTNCLTSLNNYITELLVLHIELFKRRQNSALLFTIRHFQNCPHSLDD